MCKLPIINVSSCDSLDIVISQLFGMSETTGPHTVNMDPTSFGEGSKVPRIMSVGPTMPGVKTKLHNVNSEGDGEICMWGRNIMMGYLNREDKTADDLDEEGWMHSGDLASVDKDGYVYITGRLKELLITAGGENVAPVPIEDCIKKELPAISNVVLIGDRQKYLSAFLTFKVVMDAKTDEPTNQLLPATVDWCESFGRTNIKTVDDILRGDYFIPNNNYGMLNLITDFRPRPRDHGSHTGGHRPRQRTGYLERLPGAEVDSDSDGPVHSWRRVGSDAQIETLRDQQEICQRRGQPLRINQGVRWARVGVDVHVHSVQTYMYLQVTTCRIIDFPI